MPMIRKTSRKDLVYQILRVIILLALIFGLLVGQMSANKASSAIQKLQSSTETQLCHAHSIKAEDELTTVCATLEIIAATAEKYISEDKKNSFNLILALGLFVVLDVSQFLWKLKKVQEIDKK